MEEIKEFLESIDRTSMMFGVIITVILDIIFSIEAYWLEKIGESNQQKRIKKGKYKKYVCPGCRDFIITKKDVEIKCKPCNLDFINEKAPK